MRLHTLLILLLLPVIALAGELKVGAERTYLYLDKLKGKRVALLSNHTGILNSTGKHTIDMLLRNGVNVTTIYSPEHGFRGTADAGAHVKSSVDAKTGVPIASLYDGKAGAAKAAETIDCYDVIVCDLQDVGTRFYTYYITMFRLMETAAANGKEFIVLDRPNPIGMMVDGPVLDMSLKSSVGALPIPVAHGLTLGEMAQMINGEGWLKGGAKANLTVIPCEGYTHATLYRLPVNPSPNLKSMHAIYLYPSTCYFEGTPLSLGRGTANPFEIYGYPTMRCPAPENCMTAGVTDTIFTPQAMSGAANPPLKGRKCHGRSLRALSYDTIIARGVDFSYIIDAYRNCQLPAGKRFFTPFFDLLTGNTQIRKMIEQGKSTKEIKASWQPELEKYRQLRSRYLIYPER